MTKLIEVGYRDRVVSLTLNRPQRKNALSLPLLAQLVQSLGNDVPQEAGALILSGANGCFSAGADLSELSGTIDDLVVDDAIEAVTTAIRELSIPVIAAIDGPCLGGSVDLAMSCDVRVASADAFFQVPATRMGLLYNPRSIRRLQRMVGRDTIFQLLVLGERFDAEAALKAGLISHITEEDSSFDIAMAMAQRASDNVPLAVEATKRLLDAIDSDHYDAQHWEQVRTQTLSSPERREAVARAKERLKNA